MSFYVIGASNDEDTYFCHHLAKRIAKIAPHITVEFELLLEIDYSIKLKKLTETVGRDLYTHKATHLVLRNGSTYVGGAMAMISIAKNEFGIADAEIANNIVFNRMCKDETLRLLAELGNPCVYIQFGEDPTTSTRREPLVYGTMIISLYRELCPMACDNFTALCTGSSGTASDGTMLHYKGCLVHRIVPGGWMQCGDLVDCTGANSVAAIGEGKLPDESFSVDFGCSEGGIVGYSSSSPHGNGSQFFITFGPCEWMQNSFVGFGKVVVGLEALRSIEREPTSNQCPITQVVVLDCGIHK